METLIIIIVVVLIIVLAVGFASKKKAGAKKEQPVASSIDITESSRKQIEEKLMNTNEKKYFCDFDSGTHAEDIAEHILNDPDLPELKSIIIGKWDQEMYDVNPNAILEMMVNNKEKFQHIESLFVGDMESEEYEISWILQGNYEELLNALPNLKSLKIKGADKLTLGKIDHQNLEELEIICGGLPKGVADSIKTSNLPGLKKLALYLGTDDYGYDCEISDFADLAKKDQFPNLKYLGFLDSPQQDELVGVILESDILPQLESIDISCGCLTDKGGQLILDAADKLGNLKELKASYHYMSEDMMEKLKALPFEVDVSDVQEPYEDDMWPMITE
jgi:hypothetical protein